MLARKSTSAIVVLIVVLFVTSSKSEQFHQLLTDEEYFKIFRTTRDKVPVYELAHITHNITKRSTSGARINFKAFGKEFEAFLDPVNSTLAGENTPVWRSYITPDGNLRFSKMRKGIVGLAARSYENAVSITSLVVSGNEETDTLSFYGNMEHDGVRIVAWPASVREVTREEFNRLKREAPKTSPDMTVSDYHVIIKTESFSKNFDSLKRNVREISRLYERGDNPRRKRSEAETIYPSLLISTDYANPKTTEDDLAYFDDIIYQLSFWNSVDLRFRALQDPQVRLRIAGLIFGQSRSASPWIKKNMKYGKVDIYAAYKAMQKFWYSWKSHPDFSDDAYNMAVSMTDLPMFVFDKDGNEHIAAGYGAIGGMCNAQIDADEFRVHSNLILSDHRGYDGVHPAVHELGHVLGASHDRSNGGDCDASFGYIMSPTTTATANTLQWSECSKKKISDFLRNSMVKCADKPSELHPPGHAVIRILPGRVLNANQQCQARGYYWACNTSDNCQYLRCGYSEFHQFFAGCYIVDTAADGTMCGENMACVNGECKTYVT